MTIREFLGLEEDRLTDDELSLCVDALEYYYDHYPSENNETFTQRVDEAMRINKVRQKIIRGLEP